MRMSKHCILIGTILLLTSNAVLSSQCTETWAEIKTTKVKLSEILTLCQKEANSGVVESQLTLGKILLEMGQRNLALPYIKKAASQGNAEAEKLLQKIEG